MSKGQANVTDPKSNRYAFAERLRMFTEKRGAVPELSRKTGASITTIRQWAAGKTEPSRDYLVALADALGVNIRWLATGEGPKTNRTDQDIAEIDENAARMLREGVKDSDFDIALKQGLEPAVMDRTILAGIFAAYLGSLGEANPTKRVEELLLLHDKAVDFLKSSTKDGVLDKEALKRFFGALAGR